MSDKKKQPADSRFRLNITLSEEEREQLEDLAAKDSRTVTAMAKLFYTRGLAEMTKGVK